MTRGDEKKEEKKDEGPPGGAPPQPKMINMSQFFRYVTGKDKFLMIVGMISAIIAGAILPLVFIA